MRKRPILAAAGLALAAGILTSMPVACGGGGGGGVGGGIATLGVSTILAGSSPGWRVIDPAFATASSGPAGGGTVTPNATAESPAPALGAGESLDRILISGGQLFPVISIEGFATPTVATNLRATLLGTTWDGQELDLQQLAVDNATLASAATANAFTLILDFTNVVAGSTVFTDIGTNPGDQFTIRFTNTGSGTITIDPSKTKINAASSQTRESVMLLQENGQTSFSVREHLRARVLSSGSVADAIFTSGASSVSLGANQAGIFRFQVSDVSNNAVAGALVTISASQANAPTSVAVRTDSNGFAAASFSFPATVSGTTSVQGRIPSGSQPIASYTVNLTSSPVRAFDGLRSFLIQSDNAQNVGSIDANVGNICVPTSTGGGFVGESKSALPSGIEFDFPGSATSNAQWRYAIYARTRSFTSGATTKLSIDITTQGGALIATTGSSPITVGTGLGYFTGVLQQAGTFGGSISPGLTVGPQTIMFVKFTTTQSSDTSTPGVEIVTDDTVPSTINVPGPVVFATSSTNGGKFLVSSPDPRR